MRNMFQNEHVHVRAQPPFVGHQTLKATAAGKAPEPSTVEKCEEMALEPSTMKCWEMDPEPSTLEKCWEMSSKPSTMKCWGMAPGPSTVEKFGRWIQNPALWRSVGRWLQTHLFSYIFVGNTWCHTHPTGWEGAWMGSVVCSPIFTPVGGGWVVHLMWTLQDFSEHFFGARDL